jgi:hypothetical protein
VAPESAGDGMPDFDVGCGRRLLDLTTFDDTRHVDAAGKLGFSAACACRHDAM